MIEVYIYPVTGKPYMKQIPDGLEGLQQVVGGYIEVARHPATEVVSFAFNNTKPPQASWDSVSLFVLSTLSRNLASITRLYKTLSYTMRGFFYEWT